MDKIHSKSLITAAVSSRSGKVKNSLYEENDMAKPTSFNKFICERETFERGSASMTSRGDSGSKPLFRKVLPCQGKRPDRDQSGHVTRFALMGLLEDQLWESTAVNQADARRRWTRAGGRSWSALLRIWCYSLVCRYSYLIRLGIQMAISYDPLM